MLNILPYIKQTGVAALRRTTPSY